MCKKLIIMIYENYIYSGNLDQESNTCSGVESGKDFSHQNLERLFKFNIRKRYIDACI